MRSRWKLVRKPSTSSLISPVSPISSTCRCILVHFFFCSLCIWFYLTQVLSHSIPILPSEPRVRMISVCQTWRASPAPHPLLWHRVAIKRLKLHVLQWFASSILHRSCIHDLYFASFNCALYQQAVFCIKHDGHLHAGEIVEGLWKNLHCVVDEGVGRVQRVLSPFQSEQQIRFSWWSMKVGMCLLFPRLIDYYTVDMLEYLVGENNSNINDRVTVSKEDWDGDTQSVKRTV